MTGDLPGWVIPAASVLAAVVGALALVIVRIVRGPVAVQDLWAENRSLRADLTSLETKVDALFRDREAQLNVNRIMGDGFDALSNYVERTTEATGTKPKYTDAEHNAIEKARALRNDDSLWNTLQRPPVTRS